MTPLALAIRHLQKIQSPGQSSNVDGNRCGIRREAKVREALTMNIYDGQLYRSGRSDRRRQLYRQLSFGRVGEDGEAGYRRGCSGPALEGIGGRRDGKVGIAQHFDIGGAVAPGIGFVGAAQGKKGKAIAFRIGLEKMLFVGLEVFDFVVAAKFVKSGGGVDGEGMVGSEELVAVGGGGLYGVALRLVAINGLGVERSGVGEATDTVGSGGSYSAEEVLVQVIFVGVGDLLLYGSVRIIEGSALRVNDDFAHRSPPLGWGVFGVEDVDLGTRQARGVKVDTEMSGSRMALVLGELEGAEVFRGKRGGEAVEGFGVEVVVDGEDRVFRGGLGQGGGRKAGEE